MDKYKVYLITNKINNKKYIGITIQSLEKRFNQHCYHDECHLVYKAIKKYGKENFKIEVIFNAFSQDNMIEMENHFIQLYNTIVPFGYNRREGGIYGKFSDEVKNEMSQIVQNRWNTYPEIYKNFCIKRKEYIDNKKTPIIGISIYDGSILRFPTNCKAKDNGFFVSGCLNNKDLYSNGYCWFYDENFPETYYIQKTLEKLGGKFRVDIRNGIKSIDKKTGEVKEYPSLNDVIKEGHNINAVQAVLRGSRKSYHGKFWEAKV